MGLVVDIYEIAQEYWLAHVTVHFAKLTRMQVSLLTGDTTVSAPELGEALVVARSARRGS